MSSSSTLTPDQDFTNPRYNWLRIGYFFVFLALSAYTPFASILFDSKGFSPSTIGLLVAGRPLSMLFIVPPVTYIAEVFGIQSQIMYVSSVSSALLLSIVYFAEDHVVIVACLISFFILFSPLAPLYDEHTMELLGTENRKYYGSFRLFGTFAWLIGSVVNSAIFGYIGWKYLIVFISSGFLIFGFSAYKTPVTKEKGEHHIIDVWRHMCRRPKVVAFFIAASSIGSGMAIINTYVNLFLISDEMQAPPILLGLIVTCTILIEIPLFKRSDWLHNNFRPEELFMIAAFSYCIRVLGYSIMPSGNPWLSLLLEPLHGTTYTLCWLAVLDFFKENFPKTYQNSATGLAHSALSGLGQLIGMVGGGFLFEKVGPRNLFQIAAFYVAVISLIFWIIMKKC